MCSRSKGSEKRRKQRRRTGNEWIQKPLELRYQSNNDALESATERKFLIKIFRIISHCFIAKQTES